MPYGPAKRVERGLSQTAARLLARMGWRESGVARSGGALRVGTTRGPARSVERGLSQTAARRLARMGWRESGAARSGGALRVGTTRGPGQGSGARFVPSRSAALGTKGWRESGAARSGGVLRVGTTRGPARSVERGSSQTAARLLARRGGVKTELRGLAERCELGQLAVRPGEWSAVCPKPQRGAGHEGVGFRSSGFCRNIRR